MGIYGRAKDEGIIPESLESRFDNIINERNWLIHDSQNSNSEDLYNEEQTISMINRINFITDESIELTREVLNILEEFMLSEGVDLSAAYKQADDYINSLKGN
ncbi:MAG: hypothetical protein L3J98_16285 [Gammaproteobacteria bacterium]|nr:hypothetical protein [Gammaproteobacteria bacterium]